MTDTPIPEGGSSSAATPEEHAEGAWVPDPSGRHQFRYVVHGHETDWVSDSGVETIDDHAEWGPDPTGRHQFRYFVRGQPTAAVSDNGVPSTDPVAPAPPPGQTTPPAKRSVPAWPFVLGGVVAVVLVALVAFLVVTKDDEASPPTSQPATTAPPFSAPSTQAPDTTPPTTATDGGRTGPISVFDLQVGDCIDTPTGPTATGVPCAEPHDFEVYAVFDVLGAPDAAYPGDSAVSDLANSGCQGERFSDYVGEDYSTSSIYASSLYPSESTWTQQGDREVVCLARAQSGQLTGSVQGTGQ